jgi:hypothetical protein
LLAKNRHVISDLGAVVTSGVFLTNALPLFVQVQLSERTVETADEIWSDDLLARQEEAEVLIAYLRAMASRPSLREDNHAYVLAVDASYGHGKSFFLRRFARHMAQSHPVAFVDAWVDDLEDEPLVALAATLERALEPYSNKSPKMDALIADFRVRAGRVAKIVGTGLLKRGAGLIITQAAADALGDVVSEGPELSKDIRKDAMKDAGKGLVEEAVAGFGSLVTPSMDARIARFREGQDAILKMKAALAGIVAELERSTYPPPIVIVIDELDRCRPTYAIKLLEEIKHLFDVAGIVFVLGMHGNQLAHSVSAAYGSSFDGRAYLRRFISRRYTLKSVPLDQLVEKLVEAIPGLTSRFEYPFVQFEGQHARELKLSVIVSLYLADYDLTARDAFSVIEMLETCVALAGNTSLQLPYLLPLIVSHLRAVDGIPEVTQRGSWSFYLQRTYSNPVEALTPHELARRFDASAKLSTDQMIEVVNSETRTYTDEIVARLRFGNLPNTDLAQLHNYPLLVETVSRFK